MPKYLLLFITAICLFSSCSSDEEVLELTPEEKIVGTWEGSYFQAGFGTSSMDLTISTLTAGSVIATPRYGESDLSDCDDTIYYCESASCSTTWIFTSFIGVTFTFEEKTQGGDNCADGTVTLRFEGDDKLAYKWVDITDATNTSSGELNRK